jgi:hypothetical protein
MRHLGSLLAGLFIGPIAWLLIALGAPRSQELFTRWATASTISTRDLLIPAALLASAGVLIGLVATLRWSPLGPLLVAAMYLGVYGALFLAPFQVLRAMPRWRVSGVIIDPAAPVASGTIPVLGVALLMAVFSVKRWRRWPVAAAPVTETGGPESAGEPGAQPDAFPWGSETASAGPVIPAPRESESDAAPRQVVWPQTGSTQTRNEPTYGDDGWPDLGEVPPPPERRSDHVPAGGDTTVPLPTSAPVPEAAPSPRGHEESPWPAGGSPASPWSAPPRTQQE